jgi:hypothetical protein
MFNPKQREIFSRLCNDYVGEIAKLSKNKETYEAAITTLKKRKRQTSLTKAQILNYEDKVHELEGEIKRMHISLDSLGKIMGDTTYSLAQIFLARCFDLYVQLEETKEDDYAAIYQIHQNIDNAAGSLADSGVPIFDGYYVYRSHSEKSKENEPAAENTAATTE